MEVPTMDVGLHYCFIGYVIEDLTNQSDYLAIDRSDDVVPKRADSICQ
jgi:hypothetical protein